LALGAGLAVGALWGPRLEPTKGPVGDPIVNVTTTKPGRVTQ
jgi:hypothetical protein